MSIAEVNYKEFNLTMRSKTTFGVDSTRIRVWPGQAVEDVADRVAASYGAVVVSILPLG